jgi:hypothetical protein
MDGDGDGNLDRRFWRARTSHSTNGVLEAPLWSVEVRAYDRHPDLDR